MSRNLRGLSARSGDALTLFESLAEAAVDGALSKGQTKALARGRNFPEAAIYGAASFYDFLKPENRGKKAHLCTGTVCRMSEGQAVARARLDVDFPSDEIGEMACVGRCYCAGGYEVEGKSFDSSGSSEVPFYTQLDDPVFGSVVDSGAIYRKATQSVDGMVDELELSGLRGRGGAGFPFAIKLKSCAAEAGEKYVVCNADEGDPGAFSDRFLLEQRPELVLAGMLATAKVIGAVKGFIYLRAEYPEAHERVAAAIADFEANNHVDFNIQIVRGAGSYVCGEETALLNSIEGLRPEVRVRPPFPTQAGLFGRPTLLSNVETFAAIPWILDRGGAAFAQLGRGRSTGTKLVSLDHNLTRPGVYEVEMGMPLRQLIHELAGGFKQGVKALQVGGPLGGVLPVSAIDDLTLDFESFDEAGFLLGHASFVTIPNNYPMIDFLRHLFEFMADESCGRCFPCRLGTRKGFEMLRQADPDEPVNGVLFADLLKTLKEGSLCALGGGLPLPVCNIFMHFIDEVAPYFCGEVQS